MTVMAAMTADNWNSEMCALYNSFVPSSSQIIIINKPTIAKRFAVGLIRLFANPILRF